MDNGQAPIRYNVKGMVVFGEEATDTPTFLEAYGKA